MEFYAHKREMPDGAIVTQTVREHLVGTAQRAAQCLRQVGLEHAGYLAGLLHDLGKYTEAFQQYLDEGDSTKRGSVIHTFQGCRYLMEQYHRGDIQTISCAELLAFAVGAHHGLFDCVDQMRRIGLQYRAEKQDISYEEAVAAFRQEIPTEEIETLFAASCRRPSGHSADRSPACFRRTHGTDLRSHAGLFPPACRMGIPAAFLPDIPIDLSRLEPYPPAKLADVHRSGRPPCRSGLPRSLRTGATLRAGLFQKRTRDRYHRSCPCDQ